jgi:hypothetical protein
MLAWILLAFSLLTTPAAAQAPPAVPALPDTQRLTSYAITGTTCACAVNFALYGDGTDVDQWLQVWINGVRYLSSDPTHGWVLSSPTGPLASIPRPITDGIVTFNAAQTGTVQIVGARRPRRVAQFPENRGVAARDLNQALTDIVAQNREEWDKVAVLFAGTGWPPTPSGNTNKFVTVSGSTTSGNCVNWDGSGNLINGSGPCVSAGSGVTSSTATNLAYYASTGAVVSGNGSLTIDASNNLLHKLGYAIVGDYSTVAAHYPPLSGDNGGLAVGWNFANGPGEVDLWNRNTAATTSFNWYQQTGASAASLLMSLSPNGTLALTPAINNLGFNINHNGTTTTSMPGGNYYYNLIQVNSDGTQTPANGQTEALQVSLLMGPGATGTEKYAITGFTGHNQSGLNTGGDLIGVFGEALAQQPNGGTNTGAGAAGTVYGFSGLGLLSSGATNYNCACGAEIDAAINTGASAKNRWAVSTVGLGNLQGAVTDAAYEVGTLGGGMGYQVGVLFDSLHGANPLTSTGTIIADDQGAYTFSTFADFRNSTFSNYFFRFNNFIVNGSGDTALRHVGGRSGAGTPTAAACAGFAAGAGATDTQGKLTMTSGTTCSINFAQSYTNPPSCSVMPASATSSIEVTTTTGGFAATFGTAQTALSWQCLGG